MNTHLRVFSKEGVLLAKVPEEGNLDALLAAFELKPSDVTITKVSGSVKSERDAPLKKRKKRRLRRFEDEED